jgi:hypothetical protein
MTQHPDPAHAEPGSDRERIPRENRLVPAWPGRVLAWEEMAELPVDEPVDEPVRRSTKTASTAATIKGNAFELRS